MVPRCCSTPRVWLCISSSTCSCPLECHLSHRASTSSIRRVPCKCHRCACRGESFQDSFPKRLQPKWLAPMKHPSLAKDLVLLVHVGLLVVHLLRVASYLSLLLPLLRWAGGLLRDSKG